MFKRLYRQRRRMILLAVFLVFALFYQAGGETSLRYLVKHDFGGSLAMFVVSSGLAIAIVSFVVMGFLTYIWPAGRRLVEIFVVACILSELVLQADGLLPAVLVEGWAAMVWFGVFFYLLLFVLDWGALWRLGLRMPYRATQSRLINASPDALWAAIAPDAWTTGTNWTTNLERVEPRPDLGPKTYCAHYTAGPGLSMAQIQIREIYDKPLHARYEFKPANVPDDAPAIRGTFDMQCAPQPDGRTKLTTTHMYPALTLGTWSMVWLDDMGRCELDAIQARVSGYRDWSLTGWTMRKMAGA